MSLRVFALEDDGQFGDSFLLPLRDQVRVKLMFGRDLSDGLDFFECFEDDLSLERSGILFSHGRWYPPYFSPFCCPNLWDHYSTLVQRTDASDGDPLILDTAAYDVGGGLLADVDTNTGGAEQWQDPVGFGGQYGYYWDRDAGLYLLGHRYYDPYRGRFLTRDPMGYAAGPTAMRLSGVSQIPLLCGSVSPIIGSINSPQSRQEARMLQDGSPSTDRSFRTGNSPHSISPDPSEQKALEFAFADYRWRVLSADPQQWTGPEEQRTLAVAFLNYHAAKLALTLDDGA